MPSAQARTFTRRLLPLTMAVVVAVFVGSTLYSQLLLSSDVHALDIAYNAAPSIATLADARGELRALSRIADELAAATTTDAAARARGSYAQRRKALDAALAKYE